MIAYKLCEWFPIDKLDWSRASSNSAAIHLLKANLDKVNWAVLSRNPSIFTYDYERMKEVKHDLHRDLIEEIFRPARIQKHLEADLDVDDYLA